MGHVDGVQDNSQPPELVNCLRLVKGSTDEERFAGLLVLIKYLNTRNENGKGTGSEAWGLDVRRQVFEAVGLDMLVRLLRTPSAGGTDPSVSAPEVSPYQAVAITIVACLAQDTALVPLLRPAIPHLLKVIGQIRDSALLQDALFCVYSFAKHDAQGSAQVMAQHDVIYRTAWCLRHVRQQAGKEEEAGGGEEELVRQACSALHELAVQEGAQQCWLGDGRALGLLVSMMEADRTELKLGLVPIVALMLASRRHSTQAGKALANTPLDFGRHLRSSLVQLLHGGLQESHRDSALAILVHGLSLFGQGWAVEQEGDTVPQREAGHSGGTTLSVGTSVSFFVHVLAMEVRMAAEELEAIGSEEAESNQALDVKMSRRRSRALAVLPLCLDGMHTVIRFLCNTAPPAECELPGPRWEDLPGTVLLRLRSSMQEVVRSLSSLLKQVARTPTPTTAAAPQQQQDMAAVIAEAARLLSVLLVEDEAGIPPSEALEVLPTVIQPLASERDPAILLPWISRALAAESDAAVPVLVEANAHLHLIDTLMTPEPALVQPDAMLLLHEIISRGAALPCPDHDCLLAGHPRVLQLLPYIAKAAARATTQPPRGGWRQRLRVQRYCVWFSLSLLEQFPRPEIDAVLPRTSNDYQALLEAVVQMLMQGSGVGGGPMATLMATGGLAGSGKGAATEMSGSWSSGSEEDSLDEAEEQEEREELSLLWSRTLHLLRTSSPDFKSELMDVAMKRVGGDAPQRLQQMLTHTGPADDD